MMNECLRALRKKAQGIPLDEQSRIFEEFYQLDNPERDHYTIYCLWNNCHRQAGSMKPEYTAEFRFYEELNDFLPPVAKADILDRLEPKTRRYYEVFHQCADCRRIYWEGSHMEDMRQRFAGFLSTRNEGRDVSGNVLTFTPFI